MSMWLDPPDGDAEDGIGAGLGLRYPAADGDVTDLEDAFAPVGDGEPWTPDQGYPDSSQSVRIWVDGNKRLTNVHVSNRWRERAKGTSLSSMLDEAFLLANAQVADAGLVDVEGGEAPADLDDGPTVEASEPLTWDAVYEALHRVDELQTRVAAVEAKPEDQIEPSRWLGTEAVGTSHNRMVQVTLDIHGLTQQVVFNEPWLLQSRVSEVRDAVLQAHEAAYAAFVPPTFQPGEHSRLADDAGRLTQQAMALMRQGEPR